MRTVVRGGPWMAILALVLVLPTRASAGDRVYQFRSVEDPSVSFDEARAFCMANAPFRFNVVLAARVWVHRTRGVDGQVMNDSAQAIGTAFACAQITSFAFPPGLAQNFYVKFELPSGTYVANGQCTLISNDVPQQGLVLAGCHLPVISAPGDVLGGSATSSSVFNPFGLTGFNTGSYWTLHLFTTEIGPEDGIVHSTHDHDMPTVEDPRTDAQITGAQVR